MSKAARQRRQKKQQERQQRRAAQGSARPGSAFGAAFDAGFGTGEGTRRLSQREQVAEAAGEAIDALCTEREARYHSYLARLADGGSDSWTRAVSRCLTDVMRTAVTNAWRGGWQPGELTRQVDRELSQLHASMLADMITDETRGYPAATVDDRWAAQVAGLPVSLEKWGGDADYLTAWQAKLGGRTSLGGMLGAVATAIEAAHLLHHLPVLEQLLPLPGTATARAAGRVSGGAAANANPADDRVLGKIRALLAKAESTEFAEEAEALSGRAQELMAKYSIDHALLAAAEGDEEAPGGRRVPVDNPYESPKVQLLQEVASANRCRTVWSQYVGLVTVIGFEPDLDAVELLFTSLLVQANTAMMRAGAKKDASGRSRTRAFRQSFLVSYACRIGERLSGAADHAMREATEEQEARRREQSGTGAPGMDLVPLLAAREEAVDDAVDDMFGERLTTSRAVRATDLEGWNSGRAAADLATLHNRDQVSD